MTQEAEAATHHADPDAARRSTDLLGLAFLATIGIVMTVWVSGLIWAASQLVMWLMS